MRYEQVIKTWVILSGSGASEVPRSPGPEYRVVGFNIGSTTTHAIGVIVFERQIEDDTGSASRQRGGLL